MDTSIVAVSATQLKPKFAHRTLIPKKVVALKCDCGVITRGTGIMKWTHCPACHAPIITSKEQRHRNSGYFYMRQFIDLELHKKYENAENAVRPESSVIAGGAQ